MHKDPSYDVISDKDKADIKQTLKERKDTRQSNQKAILLDKVESDAFAPMHWPMLDDGKKPTTNAMGYYTGNWYHEQKQKLRDEEKARLEAIQKEMEQKELEELERQRQHEITVAEIEKIRVDARQEGYDEGHREGEAQGYTAGFAKGQEEGYNEGLAKGHDEGLRQGLVDGREEGFAKGQQEGINSGTEMVQEQVERFRYLADMLANPIRQVDKDVTDEIVYIISRLCSVVLKREIKGDGKFLTQTVNRALELLPNAKKGATITLNTDDLALIEALIPKEYREQNNWTLEASDALSCGDVVVSNSVSKIEWRIDDRVDNLLNDFLVNASPCVNSALRESLDNCPDFDALPKTKIAPNPNLENISQRIVRGIENAPYNLEPQSGADNGAQNESAEDAGHAAEVSQSQIEQEDNIFKDINNDPFKG